MQQMAFPFPAAAHFAASDFIVSDSNRDAHRLITAWPEAWAAPGLVLTGPEGSGKSHLASMWADRAQALYVSPEMLDEQFDPSLLHGHAQVVVEHAERVASEEALFHLLNYIREQGGYALLTSAKPRDAWGFTLPDLRSRVHALPLATLFMPDEDLLSALILKLFADRQLSPAPEIPAYVLTHVERSFESIRRAVDALDAAALAEGKPLTIALTRRVLEAL